MLTAEEMISFPLLDPELQDFIRYFPQFDLNGDTLVFARAMQNAVVSAQISDPKALPEYVTREERRIEAPFSKLPVRTVIIKRQNAGDQPKPAFLHLHGGGFVMGSPEFAQSRDATMIAHHDCVIVAPAYRLAPETKFPGAIEDCYAALKWLHSQAEELGVDCDRIVIGGESAGAGLAACLAIMARDRGEIPVHGMILTAPMLDDRTGTIESANRFAGEFMWTADKNRFGWQSVLPGEPGAGDTSPYAAAARAEDLAGLPPTRIFVGSLDLFIDENIAFAQRLIGAGVATGLNIYPGAFHGFELASEAQITKTFIADYQTAFGRMVTKGKP